MLKLLSFAVAFMVSGFAFADMDAAPSDSTTQVQPMQPADVNANNNTTTNASDSMAPSDASTIQDQQSTTDQSQM